MRSYPLLLALALVACKTTTDKENSVPTTGAAVPASAAAVPASAAGAGAGGPVALAPFTAVANEGIADVVVTTPGTQSVTVTCPDGASTAHVTLAVSGATLQVRTPPNERVTCTVAIAMPAITAIAEHGTGSFAVHGPAALTKLVAEGTGAVTIDKIAADALAVEARGTGVVKLAGTARSATFVIEGTGAVVAKDLATESVKVDLQGTAAATVTATKKADISVAGVGAVNVYGNPPERTQKRDGIGVILFK